MLLAQRLRAVKSAISADEPFWDHNPSDITVDGLTLIRNITLWSAARSYEGANSGKFYFEFTHSGSHVMYGLTTDNFRYTVDSLTVTEDDFGVVRPTSSILVVTQAFTGSGLAMGNIATQLAVDLDAGKLWVSQNGSWLEGDPIAGNNPSITWAPGLLIYLMGACYNASVSLTPPVDNMYSAPSGYEAGWPGLT